VILFYRTPNCPRCGGIQDVLEEMAVAHRVVLVGPGTPVPKELPKGTTLPVLVDGNELVQGSDAIVAHLEALEKFQALWYKYQSDACYCDDQGNIE
jgi:hypothetical protein